MFIVRIGTCLETTCYTDELEPALTMLNHYPHWSDVGMTQAVNIYYAIRHCMVRIKGHNDLDNDGDNNEEIQCGTQRC